ncbi:uncharacterized protein PV09_01425 [Verruconis gallopava]|uniref:SH3 domain-containing protein n=1 Tax=Verruconis gallopava TaxID=253628 RepID=A0A0D2AKZ7_9PEZI|nr:uncharacterized protein PV09_01425 [Verruconis gallopava]KIW07453.1 hypothetical protein PV09_01425 [Verruconis gallopava]
MASLNTSQNGPSIIKSYQSIVNSPPSSGPAASSSTYGQWIVLSVAAPLVSAFQHDGGKESVLKVQSTGEGELVDLIEEFSEGRIQFAFAKVKDPNTTLPKNILISWCGEGVPERTKGYFNSHRAVVSKLLHGYHVEITARSDRDLTPESIIQKVQDASGAKYSGGGSITSASAPPPPVTSKPVFTPTRVGGGATAINPLAGRSRAPAPSAPVDDDGWGPDAPPVTRTQLEKVESAYKPTKVNLSQLQAQKEPSRYTPPQPTSSNGSEVVKGGYQPIGKVDINEIRRQARESGNLQDDRPTVVKGAYEPVGKVDIAAIRAKAQKPSSDDLASKISPAATGTDHNEKPLSFGDRSAVFQQGGRILTEMPKPKIAHKFSGVGAFTGTKAPTPGGFEPITNPKSAPIGSASRTFADEGGKTPAQIWAEKKARKGAGVVSPAATGATPTSPISAQKSGTGWESGYTGKKWAPVQTTRTGQSAASNLSDQRTGPQEEEEEPASASVSSIRDRFASGDAPPPVDMSSRPNVGGGVAIPGLALRPSAPSVPAEQHVVLPPPQQPSSPSPESEEDYVRPSSPIRVAMPVSRTKEPEIESTEEPQRTMRTEPPANPVSATGHQDLEEEISRVTVQAAPASTSRTDTTAAAPRSGTSGRRALIQYDYEKAEDNEIELIEGQYVTNIEMVDEDWWMGQNEKGETGLFPSNYVELVEEQDTTTSAHAISHVESAEPPVPSQPDTGAGRTATAQYDYEAAEDNELSFPDGAKITNVEFPDEDWWFGEYGGKSGLFPANYVQLDD